jgi:AraC family transcriptional activator of pobA
MPKITRSIPVNYFEDEQGSGISIERISFKYLNTFEGVEESHRHDRHSFFLLEKGTVSIEIDFQKYTINPFSVIYMNPDQVHRIIAFEDVTVSSWSVNNENLNPEYLALLEKITPVKPLELDKESFSIISEAVSL